MAVQIAAGGLRRGLVARVLKLERFALRLESEDVRAQLEEFLCISFKLDSPSISFRALFVAQPKAPTRLFASFPTTRMIPSTGSRVRPSRMSEWCLKASWGCRKNRRLYHPEQYSPSRNGRPS